MSGADLNIPCTHTIPDGLEAEGTNFLGQRLIKQHHTITQILNPLIKCGFQIEAIEEAMPPAANIFFVEKITNSVIINICRKSR